MDAAEVTENMKRDFYNNCEFQYFFEALLVLWAIEGDSLSIVGRFCLTLLFRALWKSYSKLLSPRSYRLFYDILGVQADLS